MAKDSKLLLNGMVLPNSGVHGQATQQDLTMMAALRSTEQLVEQWYALLAEAGLRVLEISMYTTSLQGSGIVAVSK